MNPADLLVATGAAPALVEARQVLHVGCGPNEPSRLHAMFEGWLEVRLDIDPDVRPNIVASMTDMSPVETGSMDAVYSSHNLEHLLPHEVPVALAEIRRVLKLGGFLLITLPDLQRVAELVAADGLEDTAYESPAGPIAPIDILFGHRASLAEGNLFMAHRTGFTATSLGAALCRVGFSDVSVNRRGWDLWAAAQKGETRADTFQIVTLGPEG
jgi:SAM-dependent methyltransferase